MFEKGDWVVATNIDDTSAEMIKDEVHRLFALVFPLDNFRLATKAEIRVALVDKYAELATMINRRYFVDTECNRIKLTERIVQLAHEIEVEVNKGA